MFWSYWIVLFVQDGANNRLDFKNMKFKIFIISTRIFKIVIHLHIIMIMSHSKECQRLEKATFLWQAKCKVRMMFLLVVWFKRCLPFYAF